jgi:hypothetical protein
MGNDVDPAGYRRAIGHHEDCVFGEKVVNLVYIRRVHRIGIPLFKLEYQSSIIRHRVTSLLLAPGLKPGRSAVEASYLMNTGSRNDRQLCHPQLRRRVFGSTARHLVNLQMNCAVTINLNITADADSDYPRKSRSTCLSRRTIKKAATSVNCRSFRYPITGHPSQISSWFSLCVTVVFYSDFRPVLLFGSGSGFPATVYSLAL